MRDFNQKSRPYERLQERLLRGLGDPYLDCDEESCEGGNNAGGEDNKNEEFYRCCPAHCVCMHTDNRHAVYHTKVRLTENIDIVHRQIRLI